MGPAMGIQLLETNARQAQPRPPHVQSKGFISNLNMHNAQALQSAIRRVAVFPVRIQLADA